MSMILYLCTAVDSYAPQYNMPKYVKTIAPVDSMSGMVGTRSQSISGKAIIMNVRKKKSNANGGAPYMYFSTLTRSTRGVPTAMQSAWNALFGQICTATRERLEDPMHVATDQANFAKQTKFKTIYSYVWSLEREKLEA